MKAEDVRNSILLKKLAKNEDSSKREEILEEIERLKNVIES